MNRIVALNYLIILVALSGCGYLKPFTYEKLSGEYVHYGAHGYETHLYLKENGSFKYEQWSGGAGCFVSVLMEVSAGSYSFTDSLITITSFLKRPPDSTFFKISRSREGESDTTVITILDMDGNEIPFANCLLKKDGNIVSGCGTDVNGQARIAKVTSDSLFISAIGYNSAKFALDLQKLDLIIIKILSPESIAAYRYFDQERMVIKRRKILENRYGYRYLKKWNP